MIEERIIKLINASIDGELGQSERIELESILESSAEARAVKVELQKLNNLLDGVPQQQPPPGLSQQILQQVVLPAKKPAFSLAGLFSSFQPATAGLAFAVGLLVTISFYELAPRNDSAIDTTGMVGAMVANSNDQSVEQIDSLSCDESGFSCAVTLRSRKGIFVLDFELDSSKSVEVEIAFAEAGLSFGGIAHTIFDGVAVDGSYNISGGILRVENQGRQAFTVFLPDSAKDGGEGRSISIGISSGGARIFSGVLQG